MADAKKTTTPAATSEPELYGDYRDLVRQARRGLEWTRAAGARESKNGGLRLATALLRTSGMNVQATVWRNKRETETTISVSLPAYVSFASETSKSQENDVLNAIRDSFLKYVNDTALDVMAPTSAGEAVIVDGKLVVR